MKVKAFIFDFDGTIADTVEVSNSAMRTVYRQITGDELSRDLLHSYDGPTEEKFLSRLLPGSERVAELYLQEFVREHASHTEPFDGVVSLIEEIRSLGMPVSMVTAKGPSTAKLSFEKIKIRNLFDSIYTATENDGIAKTPHIVNQLEQWSLEPREAAYIGDTVTDMAQAIEAGVVPLGAAWGGASTSRELRNAGAVSVFTEPDQVLSWLND